MKEHKLQVSVKPKLNLLLRLGNLPQLLMENAEELLQELEKEQRENPNLFITLRVRPRWFYREDSKPLEPIGTSSEIRKVEEQLRYEFDDEDLDIAMEIVSNLDHRGFFRGDVQKIAKHYGVSPEYVEDIRDFIVREIEPLGVASKNLEEFINVQLEEIYPEEKALHQEVIRLLKGESKDSRAKELLSRLKLSPFEGEGAAPKGGSVDMVFEHDGREWYIFLIDDFIEVGLSEKVMGEEGTRLKNLIFFLELRKKLLRTIGELVVERQGGFMLGKDTLKPLTLSEVARSVEVSLSTVSRLVSRKYVKTPIGVFPLRHFFLRESKQGMSKEDILRIIKEVLSSEGRGRSDREISTILREKGISIARRTVAKYRKMLEE
ncbi:MAG: RNA polymerase subunit sigma-54 [Acidobacteria bacterium]|jgi:RNA polymerase sigma-54 factor|nr:MAG: RNA polymerase subunit sigma-54 [Acidobacteriota bacterium]